MAVFGVSAMKRMRLFNFCGGYILHEKCTFHFQKNPKKCASLHPTKKPPLARRLLHLIQLFNFNQSVRAVRPLVNGGNLAGIAIFKHIEIVSQHVHIQNGFLNVHGFDL